MYGNQYLEKLHLIIILYNNVLLNQVEIFFSSILPFFQIPLKTNFLSLYL